MKFLFERFLGENRGAVATEYAFLIAFIALLAAIGMTILGNNLSTFYNDIGTALEDKACEVPVPHSDNADGNAKECKDK